MTGLQRRLAPCLLFLFAGATWARAQVVEYASPLMGFSLRLPADWRVSERRERVDFSHPEFDSNRLGLSVVSTTEPFSPGQIERLKNDLRRSEEGFRVLGEKEIWFAGAHGWRVDFESVGPAGPMRRLAAFVESPGGSFRVECQALTKHAGGEGEACGPLLSSFRPNPGRSELGMRRIRSYDGAFSLEIWPGWREVTAETLGKVPDTVLSLTRPAGTVNLRRAAVESAALREYVAAGAQRLAQQTGSTAGAVQPVLAGDVELFVSVLSLPDLEVMTGAFVLGGRAYGIESVSRSPGLTVDLVRALLVGLRPEAPRAEPSRLPTAGTSGHGRVYLLGFIFGAMGLALAYGLTMLYLSMPLLEARAARAELTLPGEFITESPAPAAPEWQPPMTGTAVWWPSRIEPRGSTAAEAAAGIRRVGVVGAGTMGSGIAQLFAQNGVDVALFDANAAALRAGLDRVRAGLERAGKREALTRLEPTPELEPLASCQLVVEAAFEDLEVKRGVFRRLGELLPPPAVLATNTSSLAIREIAAAAAGPERVVGMHFFNPAPVMKLVEVVPHEGTAGAARELAVELARRLGKTPVVSADAPGFIANRLARPFYLKPLELVSDGRASVSEVDEAMRLAGFKMGPFELMDLIGLDVNLSITKALHRGLGERFKPADLQVRMVERGWLGRKAGAGFYLYPSGKMAGENPGLAELTAPRKARADLGLLFRQALTEVAEEAGRIVQERVASAEDVDTAMRLGFNWPKGPLQWFKELAA